MKEKVRCMQPLLIFTPQIRLERERAYGVFMHSAAWDDDEVR